MITQGVLRIESVEPHHPQGFFFFRLHLFRTIPVYGGGCLKTSQAHPGALLFFEPVESIGVQGYRMFTAACFGFRGARSSTRHNYNNSGHCSMLWNLGRDQAWGDRSEGQI